jgi:hypothetical protein
MWCDQGTTPERLAALAASQASTTRDDRVARDLKPTKWLVDELTVLTSMLTFGIRSSSSVSSFLLGFLAASDFSPLPVKDGALGRSPDLG